MKILFFLTLFPVFLFGQTQIGQDINGDNPVDESGTSVNISNNGSIVAIGSPKNSDIGNTSGFVKVYELVNGNWEQIGENINGDGSFDESGTSVDLSSDGSIIAIGSPFNFENGGGSGQVRIFENISGTWTQIGTNINGEDVSNESGASVSISNNGNIVAIGAPQNNGSDLGSGHVRVYENINNVWTQIGQDIDGEDDNDNSGSAISISGNGNIIAIGAPRNNGSFNNSGHVRVYENINNIWTQIGQDIDGEGPSNFFGTSVDISNNGNIVAIGAIFNADNGFQSGHVRVYENINNIWTQIGQDIDGNMEETFGESVSISNNGIILSIGATALGNGSFPGLVRIYQYVDDIWEQIGQQIDGVNVGDQFGGAINISGDGNTMVAGAQFNDENGNNSGEVRVYDLSQILSTNDNSLEQNITIFPNPASQSVQIKIPDDTIIEEVKIYDALGKLVMTKNSSTIDTSSFSTGVYVVKVTTNKGNIAKQLIIE